MKIEWLTSGQDPVWKEKNYRNGKYVYENYVRNFIREKYELVITYLFRGNHKSKIIKAGQFIRYFFRNINLKFTGDLVCRDFYSTVFAPFDKKRKNLVIIHHIEEEKTRFSFFHDLAMRIFYIRVKKADIVIVVSEYWKRILENKGCKDVRIIYNSFDLKIFEFNDEDLIEFRNNIGAPEQKPIIYLGNATEKKGYIKAYEALKELDATFISTGRRQVDSPIINMFLSYSDYLKLLACSSLVITMSQFNEGWCRTAHEAMLCGKPVIGSGKGGMKELLSKGNQIICNNFTELKSHVEDLLSDPSKLNKTEKDGKEFACKFDLDYFKRSWQDVISTLTEESPKNILHILWSAGFGGIEKFLLDLATSQSRSSELNVEILFAKKTGKFFKMFKRAGIMCSHLDLKSGRDLSLRKYVKAFLYFRNCDILQFHSFSPLLAFFAVLSKRRIIFTEHGNLGFGKKRNFVNRFQNFCKKTFINKFVDFVSFNSEYTKRTSYKRYNIYSHVKSKVVYNGISSDEKYLNYKIENSILNKLKGNFVVGSVTRFKQSMCNDRLIRAFADFQIDKDAILLLVGDGILRPELETLITKLDLAEKTILTGHRYNTKHFQALMDICVFPFKNAAFGLVALEALLLGKPAIVFRDGGGIAELIESFSQVDIVEDISGLVKRMDFYYFSRDIIEKDKDRRIEYAKQYDIEKTAAQYMNIYKSVGLDS